MSVSRNQININPFFFTTVYGQADPVDRNRPLLHDVPQQLRIRLDPEDQGIRLPGDLLNPSQSVHVSEDEMAAEKVVQTHGFFQVHPVAGLQHAKVRPFQGFRRNVRREAPVPPGGHGQAGPVDGDAVADADLLKVHRRFDPEQRIGPFAGDAPDGPHRLDDSGEHPAIPAWPADGRKAGRGRFPLPCRSRSGNP